MAVVYVLLLIQGITGQIVLYQMQNIVSKKVNDTAIITCESQEDLDTSNKFSWYHRKWGRSKDPVWVKSCLTDNDIHKYVCKHEKHKASLEIYNVQTNDSGVYYCVYLYSMDSLKLGNGTNLNVGDISTFRTSVHILDNLQTLHPNSSVQLACVVLAARNTVYLSWNISGTYHKGQIISTEESDGSWTVMNFISLSTSNQSQWHKVTCEVWMQFPPIRVQWVIEGQGELHDHFVSKCQSFLIPMVTAGTLLVLILSIHLIKTLKLTDNKTQGSMMKNTVTKDEIVYSELIINHPFSFINQDVL
ncbi:uncharacterized protein [Phyllobates terribilis]|uniref:uncharacterized protein n=1 Tax=Phyllobates terribilis TaxID=111132 RepID=UPI003CCA75C3